MMQHLVRRAIEASPAPTGYRFNPLTQKPEERLPKLSRAKFDRLRQASERGRSLFGRSRLKFRKSAIVSLEPRPC